MNTETRMRAFLYYSGIFQPVYEVYRLKQDHAYAIQRFSSLKQLSEYKIIPAIQDYELSECGLFIDTDNTENLIESLIQSKYADTNNRISVGDVIRVYRAGNITRFFVDGIGLSNLNCF